ncbi:alpha/beta hydrolase [Aureimonas ureilytica]|uniref:alpha/beta hydrolase n=1 Tax=Aureimonas ureilytica TaxID=401562 RepID=UPI0003739AE2|nr:alpha/beta hydrolase [Aureimonas ureilytica]
MNTLHLVAPAYRDLAAAMPAFHYDPASVADLRLGLLQAFGGVYGSPDAVPKEEVHIGRADGGLPLASLPYPPVGGAVRGAVLEEVHVDPADDGLPLRALLYRPASGAVRGAVLHVHGGGWVAGNADAFAGFCSALADTHGLVVLSVDYRLVPEASGNAALDDCFAALGWLRERAGSLGFEPDSVVLLGDSAGGNLAAGTALRARDAGIPIKAQLLIYPVLDDRTGTDAAAVQNPVAGEFGVTRSYLREIWDARMEGVSLEKHAYLAPARAEDLAGLPPTFLAVGSLDILVDETIDYAARLGRAGVPFELHVYDGVFHGFDLFPGPETTRFRADLAAAVERLATT